MTLGEFMSRFRVALEKKEVTGLDGFKGEAGFNSINPKPVRQLPQTLAPQGSVMFESTDEFEIPKDKDDNIKYIKIK